MTTYNGATFIDEQIESILAQDNSNLDLLISDDFSTDDTYQKLELYASIHCNVKIYRPAARFGKAGSHFLHLIATTNLRPYDFVFLSDQDDIWQPQKVSHAIKTIKSKGSQAYSSNVTAFWGDGRKKIIFKSQAKKKFDYIFESAGPGCTYCLHSDAFLPLQQHLANVNYDNIELHDWYIYAFARTKGIRWHIDHHSYILYRQHGNNVIGATGSLEAFCHRLSLLRGGAAMTQVKQIIDDLKPELANKVYSKLWLISNISQLRRSRLDRVILFFLIILGFVNVK